MGNAPVIDFSRYIEERTAQFQGREWVFKELDAWLANPGGSRAFLLTGEPGSGKTAIASRLKQFSDGNDPAPEGLACLKPGFLAAAHFCSARDRLWVNPHTFAESLALQLAGRFPEYAKALAETSGDRQIRIEVTQRVDAVEGGQVAGVIIHHLDVSAISPEDAFNRVVRVPLEALLRSGEKTQVVLLVDALDEALVYSGEPGIVALLADAEELPDGLRLILTSRRDERVESRFMEAEGLFLSAKKFDSYNGDDIGAYVRQRLSREVQLSTQSAGLAPEQVENLVPTITRKADGNFQYIKFLLDSMVKGQRSLTDLDALPEGLDGLYHDSLGRLVKLGKKDWLENYAPLLGALSVAQEGLTLSQLEGFTELTKTTVWAALGDLQQFVEENQEQNGGLYGIYHQSLIDFLHRQSISPGKKTFRNSYFLPPEEWHHRIAHYYQERFQANWSDCDPYGLRQLVNHLLACLKLEHKGRGREDLTQEIYSVILDELFRKGQIDRLGDVRATLADLKNVLEIALARDHFVQVLALAGAYRGTIRSESIAPSIFSAVGTVDFERALQRAEIYASIPDWSRVLFLYLAWTAAEANHPEMARKAVAIANSLPLILGHRLCDALLVRIARALARTAGGPADAQDWLVELGREDGAADLLAEYEGPEALDLSEEQQILNDLNPRLDYLEQMVLEQNAEGVSMEPFLTAERAGDFAHQLEGLLVKLAVQPSGQGAIDRALAAVLINPYPRYRDIALMALGIACISVPDAIWACERLQRILETALDREGVTFTFDLPSVLLAEAQKRKLDAPVLRDYLDNAYHFDDRWGTAARARSARAAALFGQGQANEALEELVAADQMNLGLAGFATITLLSIADRCYEFGQPELVSTPTWGANRDITLLDGAIGIARTVRDPQFQKERIALVETYRYLAKALSPEDLKVLVEVMVTPMSIGKTIGKLLWPAVKMIPALPKLVPLLSNQEMKMVLFANVSARLAYPPDSPNWEGLKLLVPLVMEDGTTLDAILGRIFRLCAGQLSDAEVFDAILICSEQLTTGRPWDFGKWG